MQAESRDSETPSMSGRVVMPPHFYPPVFIPIGSAERLLRPRSIPAATRGFPAVLESSPGSESVAETTRRLERLRQQVNRLQRAVRLAIETELAGWTGKDFGSLADNRDVAVTIHELLDGHGLRVRCPECGHPAILRCSPRPGVPSGVFVFDHVIEGRRTFHGGGATLPRLSLMAKPPRRRALKPSPGG